MMTRNKVIELMTPQGPIAVEVKIVETISKTSKLREDAVYDILSIVVNFDGDSYELIENSDYPVRIEFAKEGVVATAPNLHGDLPGQSSIVSGAVPWDQLDDQQVNGISMLIKALTRYVNSTHAELLLSEVEQRRV